MLTKGAQTLPQKDAQAFKQLAKFHDSKNYKKGLKHAVQILQKHPDHPQTLSMKALFELGLGQENKALQTAKVGLMKSKMKSMFCWHTMGTIYKIKKDYLQSSKCFQNAFKFEPDNIQLLRDIAAMQIQIRDHSAHVQTRLNILKIKPNMIHNWTGFTLANHLKGDYEEMFKAFKSLDTLILSADLKPVQLSHFYIYKAVACRDAGKYNLMYQTLQKNKDKIKDQVIWHELCLESSQKLNKIEEAKKYMEFLISKFPENIQYIQKYQKIFQIDSNKQLYNKMMTQYKSKISKILYVSVIQNEQQFKKQFIDLIKPYYQKNLVSLFAEIQIIYESVERKWIQELLQSFLESLKNNNQYPDGEKITSPSQYLWAMYILSQHYSMKFETLQKSHQFIEQAIAHTNTVSEFYMVKAQIEYKMHKNIQALNTINEARKTDLADRYMNNICVKYLFKCQKTNTAEEVMKLFMREEANAYQLQNQWYIIEAGKSFLKQRNFDAGLRHLNFVNKQFIDMWANEFDFHYYCLRKWTLREYTQLIAFNNNIYADKKYMQAATEAIRYLRQYSHFIKAEEQAKKESENSAETAEKNKKKNKKKKKDQQQVEELTPIQALRKKIDYYGKQYRQTVGKNPMQQALIWSKNIATAKFVNKNNLKQNKLYGKANLQAIFVFIHFDKPLLVLKSFKKVLLSNFDKFQVALLTLRVLVYFENYLNRADANELIKEVLNEFLAQNFKGKSSKLYHQQIINQWKSQNHHLSAIKIKQSDLIIKNQESREHYINLYREELLSQISKNNSDGLQFVLYLVHNLEYYGQFTGEMKIKLNEIFKSKTSYFTNWVQAIQKLPDSTWTMWWLSEYDIHREQLQNLTNSNPQPVKLN